MKTASLFVFISAALHLLPAVLTGFAAEGVTLLAPAVVYALLALGLRRGVFGTAWLSFLVMLFGSGSAILALYAPSSVPAWVFAAILAANLCAAATLFVAIWRGTRARAV